MNQLWWGASEHGRKARLGRWRFGRQTFCQLQWHCGGDVWMVLQRKKTALVFLWQSRCHPCLPLHMACINQTMMSWRSVAATVARARDASSVRWFLARWRDWEWASFRPSYRMLSPSTGLTNQWWCIQWRLYRWPHPNLLWWYLDWLVHKLVIWLHMASYAASLPISDMEITGTSELQIFLGACSTMFNHVQPSFPWWSRPFCMSGSTTNQYTPWLLARFLQKIPGKHPNFIQFLLHHIPLLKRIITRLDIRRRTSNIAISKRNCTSA